MKNEGIHWNDIEKHKHIYLNRIPFIVASGKIVEEMFEAHFPGHDPILEIGSGGGVLRSLIPEFDQQQRIIHSDLNHQPLTNIGIHFERPRLLEANAIALPFKKDQFRNAVSLAAYDVFSSQDLSKAARELFRVVSPDGIFMHILDILPDITVLMKPYIKMKKVPFVIYESNRMCLALVNEKNLLRRIQNNDLLRRLSETVSPEVINGALRLLNKYIKDPIGAIRSLSRNVVEATQTQEAMIKILNFLGADYEVTKPVDDTFADNLTAELKLAKFKDIAVLRPTKKIIVPRSQFDRFGMQRTDANFFTNNVGNARSLYAPHLEDEIGKENIIIESTVQIVTARK